MDIEKALYLRGDKAMDTEELPNLSSLELGEAIRKREGLLTAFGKGEAEITGQVYRSIKNELKEAYKELEGRTY